MTFLEHQQTHANVVENSAACRNTLPTINLKICCQQGTIFDMRPTPQDQVNNIILHVKNGRSYHEIARTLGVGCTTVHEILERNKTEHTRNKGG